MRRENELLHKILSNTSAIGHKGRLFSLIHAVDGVTEDSDLSLTAIGRGMKKGIKPRSQIQEINYLLSNPHIYRERTSIYKSMSDFLCASLPELYIIVDWSNIVAHENHLLRASLIFRSRSMVLYEEMHPESKLGNSQVHEKFLKNLHTIIGNKKPVCIITDAGFKTDFFKQVKSQGWDYIGRILTNMQYASLDENDW